MMQANVFENGLRCKLYSDMEKILHPTISKKNISNYRIVLNEEIVPVRVFYPEKVSHIEQVIIYVHGISSVSLCSFYYSKLCMEFAVNSNQLVIAIDYDETKRYLDILKDCKTCVQYLYDELTKFGIDKNHITLMGDSIGATMVIGINRLLDGIISKSILVSPVLNKNSFIEKDVSKNDKANHFLVTNLNNFYKGALRFKKNYDNPLVFPLLSKEKFLGKGLLIMGEMDILKDDNFRYGEENDWSIVEIPLANHNFYKDMGIDIKNQFYSSICNFLN